MYCIRNASFKWRRNLRVVLFLYIVSFVCTMFWWSSDRSYVVGEEDTPTKTQNRIKPILKLPDSHHEGNKENKTNEHAFKWPVENKDTYVKGKVTPLCNGSFQGYDGLFAELSDVVIDPTFGHGKRGGENISSVLNQAEQDEYYTLDNGYFKLRCKEGFQYQFSRKTHLLQWMDSMQVSSETLPGVRVVTDWTLAVLRYEYVNLYFTMTDFYNAFLVIKMFSLDPEKTTILWLDGHPVGGLDVTWDTLFGNVTRAGEITEPVLYKHMVWGIMCYDSPLNHIDLPMIPYTEEFRDFFLSRHGVNRDYKLNCGHLRVLFLWRRDYVAHPRNPSGEVSRKIKNEDELITAIQDLLPGHTVDGVQMDKLAMGKQLEIISTTDILIGMHGAGLTHTLFLPKHAGVVEIYPTYWSNAKSHFRTMAQWRHLHYSTWTNSDRSKELPHHYTIVDVKSVVNMAHEIHHKMCEETADNR